MQKIAWMPLLVCFALFSCAVAVSDSGSGPLKVDFGDELSHEYRDIVLQASSMELVAVEPDWPTEQSRADTTTVHGYTVRGRATIDKRALRLELLAALGAGARENNGRVAACFNPRHVLIAEHGGKTCELIICFECLTFQVWNGTERIETVDLSQTPQKTFDRIFQDAGLSIANGH